MSLDPTLLGEALPSLVEPRLGKVAVGDIERLKGGYSREMWAFTTSGGGTGTQQWILCADSPQGVVGSDSLARSTEAALLDLMHSSGVPAPRVLATVGAESPLDVDWFIMERLPGTAAVGPLLRDPWYEQHRDEIAAQKARILAAIHTIDPPDDLLGVAPSPSGVAPGEVARWVRAIEETPTAATAILERSLDWLSRHPPPPPQRIAIVHGDYRTGNLLYDRTGITGVLDWEMAHLGDPVEDLAWAQLVCWRLGTDRVGGLVELDEWPRLYERVGGHQAHPHSLHFWETLCSVKMSILAWRAIERTPPGSERDLLVALHRGLGDQLDLQLLPAV